MKKLFLSMCLMTMFLSPVISQAASQNGEVESNTTVIRPRALYAYRFDSVPPKKFNGMTRIYYEYDSKFGVYIGYYQ